MIYIPALGPCQDSPVKASSPAPVARPYQIDLVKNVPYIFLNDLQFKKDWSLVSWHCTRDWIVLIIKTATRLCNDLKIEISTIEVRLRASQAFVGIKNRLEELNKSMEEFETTLRNSKIVKLHKDIKKFSRERVYPYIREDYIDGQDRGVTGLRTDSSDSDSSG